MGEVYARGALVPALSRRWRMSRYVPSLTQVAARAKSKAKDVAFVPSWHAFCWCPYNGGRFPFPHRRQRSPARNLCKRLPILPGGASLLAISRGILAVHRTPAAALAMPQDRKSVV